VAVVVLNSNFHTLTAEENDNQVKWYRQTLTALDANPAVQYIICCCHHSPFTNSKIVTPNTEVQQQFVPPFLASPKCRLFLSGHCHNFEHYQVQGKDFMVIGGGGGLGQPLRPGTKELPDLAGTYKPMFHYLSVKRVGNNLEVISRELKKDFSTFDTGLALEIKPQHTVVHDEPKVVGTAARM
jgi:hypothetical protein